MDVHENARTTPHRRRLMVERLAAGWTVAAVTASFGVDPKTVRKWCYRHAAEGEAGLLDRSSRPHRSPSRLAEEAAAELETLRRQCLPGLPSPAASVGRSRPWACSCAGVGLAGSRPLSPSRRRSAIRRSNRASSSTSTSRSWAGSTCGPSDHPRPEPADQGQGLGVPARLRRRCFQARPHRAPARRMSGECRCLPRPGARLVRQPGRHRPAGNDGEWQRLQESCLPQGLRRRPGSSTSAPGPACPDQRQGRALHPRAACASEPISNPSPARPSRVPPFRPWPHDYNSTRPHQRSPASLRSPGSTGTTSLETTARAVAIGPEGGPVRNTSSAVHGPHLAGSDTALMPYASSAEDSWARQRPAIPALPATPPSQTCCDQLRLCVP